MRKATVNTIVIFIFYGVMELIKGEKLSFTDYIVDIIIIGIVMFGLEWLWKIYDRRNKS